MFAQLIRVTVKPDAWGKVEEMDRRWQSEQAPIAPGFKGSYMVREANRPNGLTMVVLFESAELAKKNSDRPETNRWYQDMRKLMEGEPEFIDGEVVRSYLL
jgi:heme-degrading monooxygenase HmoA